MIKYSQVFRMQIRSIVEYRILNVLPKDFVSRRAMRDIPLRPSLHPGAQAILLSRSTKLLHAPDSVTRICTVLLPPMRLDMHRPVSVCVNPDTQPTNAAKHPPA